MCTARYRSDNDRRAVPVSRIVGDNKDRSCAALLRADNGIKFCVEISPRLIILSIVFDLLSGIRQTQSAYVSARHKEVIKVGRA